MAKKNWKVLTQGEACIQKDHVHVFTGDWIQRMDQAEKEINILIKICPKGRWIGESLHIKVREPVGNLG